MLLDRHSVRPHQYSSVIIYLMYMDGDFIPRKSEGPWKIFVLLLHPKSLKPSFALAVFTLPVWASNVWPLWHIKHIFNLKRFEDFWKLVFLLIYLYSFRLLERIFFVKIRLSKITPKVKLMCWILWMTPTVPTSLSVVVERRNDSRLGSGIQHGNIITLELVKP